MGRFQEFSKVICSCGSRAKSPTDGDSEEDSHCQRDHACMEYMLEKKLNRKPQGEQALTEQPPLLQQSEEPNKQAQLWIKNIVFQDFSPMLEEEGWTEEQRKEQLMKVLEGYRNRDSGSNPQGAAGASNTTEEH